MNQLLPSVIKKKVASIIDKVLLLLFPVVAPTAEDCLIVERYFAKPVPI